MSKEDSMKKKHPQTLTPAAHYARVEPGEFGSTHRIEQTQNGLESD